MNKIVIWPRRIINKLGIKIKDNNKRIKMLMASWIKEQFDHKIIIIIIIIN